MGARRVGRGRPPPLGGCGRCRGARRCQARRRGAPLLARPTARGDRRRARASRSEPSRRDSRARRRSCAECWRSSVSSDLERMLRDAREALPGPGDAATQRVRGRSVATVRRRRRRGARPRPRRRDARGRRGARRHGRIAQRTDRNCGAGACRHRLRPRAGMVRAAVAAARGARAADRRRRRQRPVRGRRRRPRARRAVRPAVLDAAEPDSARHRARGDDDAGDVSAHRADPDQSDLSEGRASASSFATVFRGGSGAPRCDPTSRSRSTSCERAFATTTSTSSCTSARRVPRSASSTRRSVSSKGSSSARSSRRARRPARARSTARQPSPSSIGRTSAIRASRGHLRAQEPRARRSSERLGMVEASVRRREQWGLGRPADRSTQRSGQHARLDHRGRAVGVDHCRRRRGGASRSSEEGRSA